MMNPKEFDCIIDGQKVSLFTLVNKNGIRVYITNYGGRIVSINTPDRNGNFDDIILGYSSISGYVADDAYMGAIVGRYADIINGGRFNLNRKEYHLNKNYGQHSIHGGLKGFDKVVWKVMQCGANALKLYYLSKDGEENYPGNMDVWTTYHLTDDNELILEFLAHTHSDTILNLTSHPYFNLSGHNAGNILNHRLMINSRKYAPVNDDLIAGDNLKFTENTPFDLYKLSRIGDLINQENEQLKFAGGYDHNFCLENENKILRLAAIVLDDTSGRSLELSTSEPALHFYSGNSLNGISNFAKDNAVYRKHDGFCLEAQHFPYSFKEGCSPSTILRAGDNYTDLIVYKFGGITCEN